MLHTHGWAIPEAIMEQLLRFFGEAQLPNFSRTLEVAERAPYHQLRERLEVECSLADLTDLNSDLGWRWWINRDDRAPIDLRISFVGPYFLILDDRGSPTEDVDLQSILKSAGLHVLTRETLERRVTAWEPEAGGTLYEYLFEFDSGLPWAR